LISAERDANKKQDSVHCLILPSFPLQYHNSIGRKKEQAVFGQNTLHFAPMNKIFQGCCLSSQKAVGKEFGMVSEHSFGRARITFI
jgi:hypothetical protein